MTTELPMRQKFALAQIIVGLIAPLLYAKFIGYSLTTTSLGVLGYWLILPFVCFLILAGMALSRSRERFWVSRSGLMGAAIAGYSAYVLPIALFALASLTYSGGGANIGLSLLALAAPGAFPIFIFIGMFVGESWAQNRAPNAAFKRDAEKHGAP